MMHHQECYDTRSALFLRLPGLKQSASLLCKALNQCKFTINGVKHPGRVFGSWWQSHLKVNAYRTAYSRIWCWHMTVKQTEVVPCPPDLLLNSQDYTKQSNMPLVTQGDGASAELLFNGQMSSSSSGDSQSIQSASTCRISSVHLPEGNCCQSEALVGLVQLEGQEACQNPEAALHCLRLLTGHLLLCSAHCPEAHHLPICICLLVAGLARGP